MSQNEIIELKAWRLAGKEMICVVERVLASQGDHAEPELVKLQHSLAVLNGTEAVEQNQTAAI